ncbi:hypothetical protein ACIQU6_34095 [Streptomyces sp. NPDC090442]|uniref:hypothetical protein n=1 Tax=Streptomyces sp. NPDC090442 TaxID=3365962 RepID=UPI00381ADF81
MTAQPAKKNQSSKAAKAEAIGMPNTIEYKGHTFSIPSQRKLPLDVLEAIEDDRGELSIIRAIVGPDQWTIFKSTNPDIDAFEEFATLVTQAAGFGDSGN